MNKIYFLICLIIIGFSQNSYAKSESEESFNYPLFDAIIETIHREYVEDIDNKELQKNALNGMLAALDPHSGYLTEAEFEDMKVQTTGQFGGLGIEVTLDNGLIKVVSPIDDTPATQAGVKAGDYISHIDGEPVMGMTLIDAVKKMRGTPNTKIKLTILREGETDSLEFILVRDIIKIRSVKAQAEGDIAYIRISSFTEQTAGGLKKEFLKIKGEIGEKNLKGVIIDLRNNPGGILDQAVAVSDSFLNSGEIVSIRGKNDENSKSFKAHNGDLAENLPIVILINSGSASASEIVAGALQDHKRAVILGTKSFGKGSVQTVRPIKGYGAIRLTTARYYTPLGRSIQAQGIDPDIIVEQAKLETLKSKKMTEADLRGHLENENNKNNLLNKHKNINNQYKLSDNDYQISRAVDAIRLLNITKSKKEE